MFINKWISEYLYKLDKAICLRIQHFTKLPSSSYRVCVGRDYSVFGSDNGIVMTTGDGSRGCLGHGDYCSSNKPRLIEALLR